MNNTTRRAMLKAGALVIFSRFFQSSRSWAESPARIGVVGAGHIGGTIGGLWVKKGHRVMFSSRHPDELKPLVMSLGSLAQAGSVGQAIEFGDALFFGGPSWGLQQHGG